MVFNSSKWNGTEYFKIKDFHHLEFYVGNAKQAVYFYTNAFGFQLHAFCGPETGIKDKVSYVLKNNSIYFIITTPLSSKHAAAKWLEKHGDGVYDISFSVDCHNEAYESCISRGAKGVEKPFLIQDNDGNYGRSSIKTYGDTIHSFIEDSDYNGVWAPNFKKVKSSKLNDNKSSLLRIDHVVGNVETGSMDKWGEFYNSVFGFPTFVRFDETDISTKYSALKSIVVRSKNWKVKMPINEPARGLKKSQIEEYLDFNEGPGVQHIAILTNNIIETITELRKFGVEFLDVPDNYYNNISERIGHIDENIEVLKKLKILIDRDEEGYLLQLFTKPLEDRPTLFIEIIERKGSKGFGQGNFQALFEAIEKEQEKRGNL